MKTAVEVQIEEMLEKGERWNIIAKTLHVSKRTIAKVSKRMNEVTCEPPPVSEVFKMFEQDKTPMDIVKTYNAEPETIEKWLNAWLNMNKNWASWQEFKAQQTMKASEKDGKKAEEVKKAPPFTKHDWRSVLEPKKG